MRINLVWWNLQTTFHRKWGICVEKKISEFLSNWIVNFKLRYYDRVLASINDTTKKLNCCLHCLQTYSRRRLPCQGHSSHFWYSGECTWAQGPLSLGSWTLVFQGCNRGCRWVQFQIVQLWSWEHKIDCTSLSLES